MREYFLKIILYRLRISNKKITQYSRRTAMFKRKQKLINKKFQLKTVFTVISISAISLLLIVLIMLMITANNTKMMKVTVTELNRTISVENALIESLIDYDQTGANTAFIMKIGEIRGDHDSSIRQILSYVSKLESVIKQNYYIIIIILALFIVQCIIFFFYIIHFTHRIVGPVQVITKYMENIINGEKADFRALRDKDELKEFYTKFIEMVTKLDKNQVVIAEDTIDEQIL
jgi:hypothetical protein